MIGILAAAVLATVITNAVFGRSPKPAPGPVDHTVEWVLLVCGVIWFLMEMLG